MSDTENRTTASEPRTAPEADPEAGEQPAEGTPGKLLLLLLAPLVLLVLVEWLNAPR